MDFIKTSSLRALSELTFQRNWNGLIWMSRKGVMAKRVKTVQTALSRTAAKPQQRPAEKRMFTRSAKSNTSVPPSPAEHTHHDPGSNVPRSASHNHSSRCRARPCRASREERLAAAQLTYHGRCAVRAGSRPASGQETSANLHPSDHSGRPRIVRPRPFRSCR
ncbi:unnamed protein product [Microthlaspi erraticum]|uniref:Uncharacterized protein n=1 Tax=Microthlaspi erraticum TaxID=1685480 RepID=A0A6D2KLW5_9BRAS|nr:unnamed protein product [Microthlaspi erraticum]